MQKRPITTIVISAVILSGLSWLFVELGNRGIVPIPLALVYPFAITEGLGSVASAAVLLSTAPIVFILLGIHLFRGSERIPSRTWAILLPVGLVDIWFLGKSMPFGLEYDGVQVTLVAMLLNTATLVATVLVGVR